LGAFFLLGANVLEKFEEKNLIGSIFFTIGGIFIKVGGKKLFWDRENQLFWELYDPCPVSVKLPLRKVPNISDNEIQY